MSTPPPQNPYAQPQPPFSPSDERLWATLVHVGGIFLGFWSGLIGYLVLKDRGPLVRQHTAAALNFQATMAIAAVVGAVLTLVAIGFAILAAVYIMQIVFGIIAAMAANNGQYYKYPLSIEFVR